MSTRSKIVKAMIYVFLTLLALVYLLPLIWVFITSLKDDAVLMISPWALPERPMFEKAYCYVTLATINSLEPEMVGKELNEWIGKISKKQ